MGWLTGDGAARLLEPAARRCAAGSRGPRARWACAVGGAVAQEAVRAARLPDTGVRERLAPAGGPGVPDAAASRPEDRSGTGTAPGDGPVPAGGPQDISLGDCGTAG
ncbi:hypothetical protein V1L54_11370 [Streptomyces sp. TRM 70361]|uniref:hypothetical protein n=1 Tax=Streptomyces sp. TRM 70361 TaxID=3116553 RepID=UPI002E7B2A20|nr:hypothetical protein [Streptomyces sp. TRM 70361]MEE1939992.1 hypothetical protein [Streptomyces sp. TRM 70361]